MRLWVILILVVQLCLTSNAALADEHASLARAEQMLTDQPWADEAAWQVLAGSGLPLTTPHADDETLSQVTFAFRGNRDVSAVRLDSVINAPEAAMIVSDYQRDFTLPLTRLAGSDIWVLTLDVPRDVQASYSFLVTTTTGTHRRTDPANTRHLRGNDAEALLIGDRVRGELAVRPLPPRLQRPPQLNTFDSEALDRTVFLKIHLAPENPAGAGLLVLYDSFLWGVRAPAWEIVHNLVSQGYIPPTHVVLIDQLDVTSARHNYADQSAFIADELLPYLRDELDLDVRTRDIVLGGASRRGLAAAITAFERPDAVGAALSLSGSFYWAPDGEPMEWLSRQVDRPEQATARFYLAAGSLEYVHTSTNRGHVMLDTNRRMASRLEAFGYDAEMSIFSGGHDVAAWRSALAEGLIALLGEAEEG
jgi:enterochelin esterase-like enzyme